MEYSVPQHIDPNQIFLVNFSELEGRWDPIFTLYDKKVKNEYFFSIVQLKDLLLKSPQYGTAESGIERKSVTEPRYIRITDIDELGNLIGELGATAKTLENQYVLNEGDILFARSGATVGKTYLHKTLPYQCFFAGYMIRVVVDCIKILPEYLFVFTQSQPYKDWVRAIQRTAAQPNINAEEYKSLPIPLPPLSIQQQIVDRYNTLLKLRCSKLSLSKQKLASIDEYLLGKLGISLPKDDFQELNDRIFSVRFKDVVDNRFDPFYYLVSGKKVTSTSFANTQLKDIANIVKGISITSDAVNKNGQYPVIAGGQTSPYNHDQYNFGGNVITISASGAYSGYVWYHEKPIFASDCSVIYSKDEKKFLTRYIFEVLKVQQQQIYNLQQGAGQPHVYPEDLGKLIIPEVSLEKQTEIVAHISAIRAEAKSLENEAEEVLTKAREEVEQMILNKA